MEPRKDVKQEPKAPSGRRNEQRRKLKIVKLEERIAPKLAVNHNDALVRDPAKAKPTTPDSPQEESEAQVPDRQA